MNHAATVSLPNGSICRAMTFNQPRADKAARAWAIQCGKAMALRPDGRLQVFTRTTKGNASVRTYAPTTWHWEALA